MNVRATTAVRKRNQAIMRKTQGFTLVELLVVIAIIGILVALLLPAVQAAREAARRSQCVNNLKQLALAANNHLSTTKHFPTGGWGFYWIGDADRGFGDSQPGGWAYNLLPFMEQQALYDLPSDGDPKKLLPKQLQGAQQLIQTPVPEFACPSRRAAASRTFMSPIGATLGYNVAPPPSPLFQVARGDYAINSGDQVKPDNGAGPVSIDQAESGTYKWCVVGTSGKIRLTPAGMPDVANCGRPMSGVSFLRSEIKTAQITDGLSHTYLVGERYLNPLAYEDSNAATGDVDAGDNENWATGYNNDNFRTTDQPPVQDTPGLYLINEFGGVHSGAFNMSFADGHVDAISYDIEPELHRANGNRNDGN